MDSKDNSRLESIIIRNNTHCQRQSGMPVSNTESEGLAELYAMAMK